MDNNLQITKITNPFYRQSEKTLIPYCSGITVTDVLEMHRIPLDMISMFTVIVNGRECRHFNTELFPGDSIAVVAKIHDPGGGGDGGKNTFSAVAMIATVILAGVLTGGALATAGISFFGMGIGISAVMGGLGVMGGMILVNSLLPTPEMAGAPMLGGGGLGGGGADSESPTYGWKGGAQNSWQTGRPYPVLYGKYLVAGQIINHWIETNNVEDYQTVKMLIVMSEGICKTPVESVDDIWVDNRIRLSDIKEYEFETTKGGLDQDTVSIGNFDQLHQYQSVSAKIEDQEVLVLDGDAFAFVDTSPLTQTVTNTGVIQDVVTKKFGAGSMHFDNVGDQLSVADADFNDFSESDFTVRFFYYPILWATNQVVWGKRIDNTRWFALTLTWGNTMWWEYVNGGGYQYLIWTNSALTNGAWNHIELTRQGNWYYIFLNGILQQSKEWLTHTFLSFARPMTFGTTVAYSGMNGCNAYLDDIVVIKGKALHTESFDVPTEPYSKDWGFTVETKGKAEKLIPHIEFPGGLYEVDGTGKLIDRDCNIEVNYKVRGASTWILRQGTFSFTSGSAEPSVADEIEGNTSGAIGTYVSCEVTSGTWGAGTAVGTMVLKDVVGTFSASETFNNNTTVVNNIATAAAAATDLHHHEVITTAQRVPVRRQFPIDVDKDNYDVQIVRVSDIDYDTKYVSAFYWTGFDEILAEELKYPGLSLLAISIQASEQLNSTTPNITALWDRGTIAVPDWFPAHRDFTDYTKVDPNGRFTSVLDYRIEVTGLTQNEDAYIYKDMGQDCFDGDFLAYMEIEFSAMADGDNTIVFGLANLVDDFNGIDTASGDELAVVLNRTGAAYKIMLYELDAGTLYSDSYTGALNTKYYLTIKRDEAVGTYGTLYCYIYSDEARSALFDTLTLTLHTSKKDLRYLYAVQSWNNASGVTCSCDITNLEFVKEVESSNSAWGSYDLITHDRYGCQKLPIVGTTELINEANWQAWADNNDGTTYADEKFTKYVETDPNARFTVIEKKITVTGLTRNEDAYIYRDFGPDYFDSDFEHQVAVKVTAIDDQMAFVIWGTANLIDDVKGIEAANGDELHLLFYRNGADYHLGLKELDGGTEYTNWYSHVVVGTTYYLTVKRDESVGTYGTLYCYVYFDSTRNTLLDTLILTLHTNKKDFRYLYGVQSSNNGAGITGACEISNLSIGHTRVSCNGVLDSSMAVTTALQKFEQIGRGKIIRNGRYVNVVYEKPEDTHSHVYSSGTHFKDTFKLEFIDRNSVPDVLNIEFNNARKLNYVQDKIPILSSDYDSLTRVPQIETLKLWGCTDQDVATRFGIFRMQMNEMLNRAASFEEDVNAIATELGDMCIVEHSSDKVSWGGLLADQGSSDSFTIVLDQEVGPLAASDNYKLWLQKANDTLVERYLEAEASATDTVEVKREDYTDYTEVDPNARFAVITNKITVNGLTQNEDAYIYYDFGVDYFNGNYEIQVTVKITASDLNCRIAVCSFCNHIGDVAGPDMEFLYLYRDAGGAYKIRLYEIDPGGSTADDYVCSLNTIYYLIMKRDESVGTYGTIYCLIYSDSARSNLLDTLSLTLQTAKTDFRYLYGVQSYNTGSGNAMSAEISDLRIHSLSGLAEYDVFAIGKSTGEPLKYRMLNLSRTVDTTFKLGLLEYDEDIYYHDDFDQGNTPI